MNSFYTPKQRREIERAIIYMIDHFAKYNRNEKPVIIHSIIVGYRLMELKQNKDLVIAGFLHDLVEDSNCSIADIKKEFGNNVAKLVSAITVNPLMTNYKKRYKILMNQIISYGQDAALLKAVDGYENLLQLKFEKSFSKRQVLIWEYGFVLSQLNKAIKHNQTYQEFNTLFKKIKHNWGRVLLL